MKLIQLSLLWFRKVDNLVGFSRVKAGWSELLLGIVESNRSQSEGGTRKRPGVSSDEMGRLYVQITDPNEGRRVGRGQIWMDEVR